MRSNYKKLGGYIRQVDERNSDGSLGEDNLYGISVTKDFIVTHANLVGVTFDSYKVVGPRQFAYIPDTSRRGDKIAISLNLTGEKIIVSSICTVFEIADEDQLLPEYLMLWFMRPEFDRYARFMSNGSAREVFDWDCMCGVELPVPTLPKQRKIVRDYQIITDRIGLLQKINGKLSGVCDACFESLSGVALQRGTLQLKDFMYFGNGKARPDTVGHIPVYGGNGIMSLTDKGNAENVTIIGRVGAYCGSVYIEENKCWISDNAIFAKSIIDEDEYFDYCLLNKMNLYSHHVGTGQQLLTQGILNAIPCPAFTTDEIHTFNRCVKPLFRGIKLYASEICRLEDVLAVFLSALASQKMSEVKV